jgi:hypothetical protein
MSHSMDLSINVFFLTTGLPDTCAICQEPGLYLSRLAAFRDMPVTVHVPLNVFADNIFLTRRDTVYAKAFPL